MRTTYAYATTHTETRVDITLRRKSGERAGSVVVWRRTETNVIARADWTGDDIKNVVIQDGVRLSDEDWVAVAMALRNKTMLPDARSRT